jgi:MHS family proline/betaine transporter-like MFS transporter
MSTIATAAADPAITVSRRGIAVAVAASCLGWSLALFDLLILLYVAPVVGRLFFPANSPMLSLTGVYAGFAVTMVMRPVGAAVFGRYADLRGRKPAMLVAVTGVGLVTASFGALPTVPQIGTDASVLFILLRVVQGMFVGGVVASTHTVGIESVPARWRGLVSGSTGLSAGVAALLASLAYFLAAALFPGDRFAVWGWRCMFFCGLLTSFLAYPISRYLEESPAWTRVAEQRLGMATVRPLSSIVGSTWRGVLLTNLLITFGGGAGYYVTSGYLPSFLKLVVKLPDMSAAMLLMAASVASATASLLSGAVSERVGRKAVFLVAAPIVIALPTVYLVLAVPRGTITTVVCVLAVAFLGNAGSGPTMAFLNERFPAELRASGTALSWNIGFGLGGMVPALVSLASTAAGDVTYTLAFFAAGIFAVFTIGALSVPETRGQLDSPTRPDRESG